MAKSIEQLRKQFQVKRRERTEPVEAPPPPDGEIVHYSMNGDKSICGLGPPLSWISPDMGEVTCRACISVWEGKQVWHARSIYGTSSMCDASGGELTTDPNKINCQECIRRLPSLARRR